MEEMIKKALAWLKTAPKWAKVAVPFILAALIAVYMFSSCNVLRAVEIERRQTRSIQDTTTVHVSSYVRTTHIRQTIGVVMPETSRHEAYRRCVLTP